LWFRALANKVDSYQKGIETSGWLPSQDHENRPALGIDVYVCICFLILAPPAIIGRIGCG
jgi:hypothetical protein